MNTNRLRLMRIAARIPRVHTRPPIHKQTVGEHTFGVLAILREVCQPSVALYEAALYHDAPEAVTGDVPAPAKWDSPALTEALNDVEDDIIDRWRLPNSRNLNPQEERLLKFADLMELALFSIEEVNMGNRGMAKVAENALTHIAATELSDINSETLAMYSMALALLQSGDALNQWEDR